VTTTKLIKIIIGAIIALVLVISISSRVRGCARDKEQLERVAKAQEATAVTQTVQYEWYWEPPPGQFVRGMNKGGPFVAEVDIQADGDLWVNIYYTEYQKKEVTKVRLGQVSSKSWEGPWEQKNPQDEGRCDLHEISSGVWSGTMTGKAGIPAFCKLIKKQK
jgi:hypothetical protein